MSSKPALLIDGALVPDTGESMPVINPATAQPYIEVPVISTEQSDLVVAAARKALPGWSRTSLDDRRAAILKMKDVIAENREAIARSIVMEQGKPLPDALAEVERALTLATYYAGLEVPAEVYRKDANRSIEEVLAPLGVVVGIVPWNYPFSLGMLKLIPAVLMGNTFIWKPAPTTPVTSLLAGELIKDLFPRGVVNVIADRGEIGEYLTRHPGVACISFIGSSATGKKVQATGASTLKRVSLELGGNDAAIVLDDADIPSVATRIARSAFADTGQACVAVKRVYAHDTIYDDLCSELAKAAKEIVVGAGFEQGSRIGPLQNAAQYERARRFLDIAHRDGNVIAGGEPLKRDGYFIAPTVVRDIANESELVAEEQFAPILPVVRFTNVEDAVEMANDSRYGLGGSVWSRDSNRARSIAIQIESGTVWINDHCDLPVDIPLRGAKESGIGADYGVEGLLEYARKTVLNTAR